MKDAIPEKQDETEYFNFVLFSYALSIILFMKLKYQLSMFSELNNVVTMIEQSLKDALNFFIYYAMLIMFFCVQFMILGSVTSNLDYPGLYGPDENSIDYRFPYYLV